MLIKPVAAMAGSFAQSGRLAEQSTGFMHGLPPSACFALGLFPLVLCLDSRHSIHTMFGTAKATSHHDSDCDGWQGRQHILFRHFQSTRLLQAACINKALAQAWHRFEASCVSLELRMGARLGSNTSVGGELIYAGLDDEVPDEDRSFLRMHEAR